MTNGCQAVFLGVDTADLKEQLVARGAAQNLPRKLLKRLVYDGAGPAETARVELRDEGHDNILTLQWNCVDDCGAARKVHIETGVSDLGAMAELLMTIGLQQWLYEEHYREAWQLDGVVYGFEDWPHLPPILILDGADAAAVSTAAQALGLDPAQDRSGSVAEIYHSELGREINARHTSTYFADPEPPLTSRSIRRNPQDPNHPGQPYGYTPPPAGLDYGPTVQQQQQQPPPLLLLPPTKA